MASVLEICNVALLKLGDTTIGDLTEDSRAAKLCNNLWNIVRDDVFRSFPWNCLQKRATLASTATTPTWGYDHNYQLPTDPYCLRVLSMEENEDDDYDYRIEGRLILTDADTCNILYIAREEDPEQYDMMLVNALATRLASEIAYPLTGNATMADTMIKAYQSVIRQARGVDSQEGKVTEEDECSWLKSRE